MANEGDLCRALAALDANREDVFTSAISNLFALYCLHQRPVNLIAIAQFTLIRNFFLFAFELSM